MNKTTAILAGLIAAYALGMVSFRNGWFPLNIYRDYRGTGSLTSMNGAKGPFVGYFHDTTHKTLVACPKAGPRTFTFIATGQSLASNRSMNGEPDFKARDGAVNFLAGKCYRAADPLLGGDLHYGGSPWTHLADMMVASGRYDHIVAAMFAVGNTYVKTWAEFPPYTDRPAELSAELTKAGLPPDAILRMIGENDSWYNDQTNTTRDNYMARERKFFAELRRKGITAPIYIAEETRCASLPFDPVASAQRNLVDESVWIRRGPNIDSIGFEGRWDGCHLTYEGRRRAGGLWRDVLLGD